MPIYCDDVIRKALSQQFTDKQIDKFLLSIDDMFSAIEKATLSPQDKALRLKAQAAKKVVAGMARRRANIIQRSRRVHNSDLVMNAYAGMEWRGIESLIVGTQYNREASHFSVDHFQKGLEEHYVGRLVTGIDKAGPGLLKLLRSGKLDREIAEALWKLERPQDYTGSAEAWKIAEVIHDLSEQCRLDQNKMGAAILKLPGYIVRQSHDQARIYAAGRDTWKNFIRDKLDWTHTADGAFDPARDPQGAEKFLDNLWAAFASGIHEKAPGAQIGLANPLTQAQHVGSLAAKLNQNRVIHFKDSDAWFDYNAAFGYGNLREAVLDGARKSAKNVALMRVFGPSPRAGFENLTRDVARRLKAQGRHEAIHELDRQKKRLMEDYLTVDGSADIAGNVRVSRIGRIIRAWNNMTKLGGVLISSLTDMPSFASEFAYHGQGWLGSLLKGIYTAARHGRGSKAEKEILADCGVFFDSMASELTARFRGNDITGKVDYLSHWFFKLNGLSFWTDIWKKAAGLMLSHNLGRWAAKPFASLKHAEQRLLSLYGITEEAWNLLRQGNLKAADGRNYLTPNVAQDIPDQAIEALMTTRGEKFSAGRAQAFRDDIEGRLRTLIRDRVSYAVLEPDARTRAFMYRGTKPGTALGETLRFVLQFKSFPTAFLQKLAGRELLGYEASTIRGGLKNILIADKFHERSDFARMFLMMTLFGYGSMTVKQLLAGKNPRPVDDPRTWIAAAAQGGGLGFFGDFLFGDKSRVGSSFYSALGGPTLTTAESAYNIWLNIRDGEGDVASNSLRLAQSLVPGNNLFYFRPAFDYLIGYNLYEMLNPGYIGRMRRRIKRENNQTFWLEPKRW